MIQLQNVSAGHGGHAIVTDVTLDFTPGEVLVILGANGCGKTTLLKTALGLIPPLGGRVLYDGAELRFEKEALNAIADKAIERKIGARGLRAVMEGLLTKVMYDIPSDRSINSVTITADCVEGKEEPVIGREQKASEEKGAELPADHSAS